MITLLSIVSLLASFTSAATPAEWRSMSIYQVMVDRFGRTDNSTTAACDTSLVDYCGGTWQGIINHLDYIQGMGFDAVGFPSVWISPVNANTPKGYHGYWTQDFYAENSKFGTAADLKALSAALHDRKMSLMVDVAVNAMGYLGTDTAMDFADYNPFNDQKYFHPDCTITDFSNQTASQQYIRPSLTLTLKKCWLAGLPDLKTDDKQVADILNSWVKDLVANFSSKLCLESLGTTLANHILYKSTAYALMLPSTYSPNFGQHLKMLPASTLLARFLMATHRRYVNFRTFSAVSQITQFYQGLEQHLAGGTDPANREAIWLTKYSTTSELYTYITSLNAIRKMAMGQSENYTTTPASIIYNDTSTIVMMKGVNGSQLLTVASNKGASVNNYTLNVGSTNYTSNEQLVQLFDCSVVTAGDKGSLAIPMDGQPKVFYPATALSGSKICPGQQKKSGSVSSGNNSNNSTNSTTSGASQTSSMGLVAPVSFLLLVLGSLLL
ncbi:MAG: hypothetical protein Q9187_002027 [Circinaria calcarea]